MAAEDLLIQLWKLGLDLVHEGQVSSALKRPVEKLFVRSSCPFFAVQTTRAEVVGGGGMLKINSGSKKLGRGNAS